VGEITLAMYALDVERLIEEAVRILDQSEAAGLSVALIGGLAVRAWAGPHGRETFDIDLLVGSEEQRDALGTILERRGYVVLDDPWWRRAIRQSGGDRMIVDWTGPSVVNPKTLERFRVAEARARRKLGNATVPVIELADLLIVKLLAGRDQDIADVISLVGASAGETPTEEVLLRARAQALGTRISDEASRLRFGVHTARVTELAERLLGRELLGDELVGLERFFEELMQETQG
jgi:hypothetical protein